MDEIQPATFQGDQTKNNEVAIITLLAMVSPEFLKDLRAGTKIDMDDLDKWVIEKHNLHTQLFKGPDRHSYCCVCGKRGSATTLRKQNGEKFCPNCQAAFSQGVRRPPPVKTNEAKIEAQIAELDLKMRQKIEEIRAATSLLPDENGEIKMDGARSGVRIIQPSNRDRAVVEKFRDQLTDVYSNRWESDCMTLGLHEASMKVVL